MPSATIECEEADVEALSLIDVHYNDVLSYCRRHTPDMWSAQDAAQETFLRALRARSGYRSQGKPLAWLLTIARNVCIDAARRRSVEWDELPDEVPDDTAATRTEAEQRCRVVGLAMSRMDPAERELLELRYDQGLRVSQVAKVLGISRFAASRRINKALDRMKYELEQLGEEGIT